MKPAPGVLLCSEPFFADLASSHLASGQMVRFQALGRSMWPFIRDGDWVAVEPLAPARARRGDVLFYRLPGGGLRLHRLLRKRRGGRAFLPKGDAALWLNEGWLQGAYILGRVARVERGGREIPLAAAPYRWLGWSYSLGRVAWHLVTAAFGRR